MTGRGGRRAQRVAIAVYLLCFGYGAATHGVDFVRLGWWPYDFGPAFANLFWNLLLFLDAAVVALLLAGRRRVGLALALAVIGADVAINSYVWLAMGIGGFGIALPVQACVLGFVLGSLPFLWKEAEQRGSSADEVSRGFRGRG